MGAPLLEALPLGAPLLEALLMGAPLGDLLMGAPLGAPLLGPLPLGAPKGPLKRCVLSIWGEEWRGRGDADDCSAEASSSLNSKLVKGEAFACMRMQPQNKIYIYIYNAAFNCKW